MKALEGVAVPVFCAEGLLVTRASGQTFFPFYFALEDLAEDWTRLTQSTTDTKLSSSKPVVSFNLRKKSFRLTLCRCFDQVVVKDLKDVLCLADGIQSSFIAKSKSLIDEKAKNGAADKVDTSLAIHF